MPKAEKTRFAGLQPALPMPFTSGSWCWFSLLCALTNSARLSFATFRMVAPKQQGLAVVSCLVQSYCSTIASDQGLLHRLFVIIGELVAHWFFSPRVMLKQCCNTT